MSNAGSGKVIEPFWGAASIGRTQALVRATRISAIVIATVLMGACSEREPQAAAPPTRPPASETMPPAVDTSSLHRMSGKTTAGGVEASYEAFFDAEQLKVIREQRTNASLGGGEYVYYGGRLLEYRGAALSGSDAAATNVRLTFDMQGALQKAQNTGDALQPTQAEISAIVSRAQLLRSLALARRSSSTHQTH